MRTLCVLGGGLGYWIGDAHGAAVGLTISAVLVLVFDAIVALSKN